MASPRRSIHEKPGRSGAADYPVEPSLHSLPQHRRKSRTRRRIWRTPHQSRRAWDRLRIVPRPWRGPCRILPEPSQPLPRPRPRPAECLYRESSQARSPGFESNLRPVPWGLHHGKRIRDDLCARGYSLPSRSGTRQDSLLHSTPGQRFDPATKARPRTKPAVFPRAMVGRRDHSRWRPRIHCDDRKRLFYQGRNVMPVLPRDA